MRKLETIVEILDNLILNNDINDGDLSYVKSYIEAACSKYRINSDNVLSDFLLYATEVYNTEMPQASKCSWVKNTISGIIKKKVKNAVKQNEYIRPMYNSEDVEGDEYEKMVNRVNLEFVEKMLKQSFTDMERDIYQHCLLDNVPQKIIADKYGVSEQTVSNKVKIVKDKIKKTLDF